jgi:hypothetical protein
MVATTASLTKLPYPTAAVEKKLKPYPYNDMGSNPNSAIRMIRMGKPQCPIDGMPELKQRDGTYKANPNFTGEVNCQQAFKLDNYGHWAVLKCEKLGHNPYFRKVRRPFTEEVVDAEGYITETRTRYKMETLPNVINVSDNVRHSSGREIERALGKGCKFIWELGYQHPCEFRGCSQPWRIETKYGRYCNEQHARLIGADVKRKVMNIVTDAEMADDVRELNEEILDAIALEEKRA